MIKLTKTDGLPVYLAPEHIHAIIREETVENGMVTKVYEEGDVCWWVKEPPEEVARKVLDYRLLMEKYKACNNRGRPEEAKYALWDLINFLEKEKSTSDTVE